MGRRREGRKAHPHLPTNPTVYVSKGTLQKGRFINRKDMSLWFLLQCRSCFAWHGAGLSGRVPTWFDVLFQFQVRLRCSIQQDGKICGRFGGLGFTYPIARLPQRGCVCVWHACMWRRMACVACLHFTQPVVCVPVFNNNLHVPIMSTNLLLWRVVLLLWRLMFNSVMYVFNGRIVYGVTTTCVYVAVCIII